jgi:hypothetical protein
MARITTELLYAVKTGNAVPSSPSLVDDTRILRFADEEVEGTILPAIYAMNQNYLLNVVPTALTAGLDTYQVNERALGRTLRDLKLYDGTQFRNMVLINLEDAHLYTTNAYPVGFYFFGDSVVVVPPPTSSSLSIYQYIFQRPGRFCAVSDAALVVSVASDVVTVTQTPSGIIAGTSVDFIQGRSGNKTLAIDTSVSSVSATSITFATGATPTGLAAGDWIAVAQTTPVVQFPEEAFSLLVTLTSIRVLESIGDYEGANALKELASDKKKSFEKMIAPRIQGEPIKIITRGLLRRSRSTWVGRGIV